MAAPAFAAKGSEDHGVGTSQTPGVPAGVVSGSGVVLFGFVDSTATVSSLPSGFAHAEGSPVAVSAAGGSHSLVVAWKRATGSESGTYTVTLSTSVYSSWVACRYTDMVSSGTPFDTPTDTAVDTGTVSTSPAVSIDTADVDRLVIHSASNWSGGAWTPPTGFTERVDEVPDRVMTASDKTQASAGNTGTVQATCAGTDRMTAWLGAMIGTTAGGTSATATPSVVAATTTVGSVTVAAGSVVTPSAVAATATVGSATVVAGSMVTPATVAAVATVPAPTVSAGGAATATPTTVAAVAAVGTASVVAGSVVAGSTVAGVTTIAAPTIAAGAVPTPATVAGVVTVPAPSVSAGGSATASPTTVAAAATIAAPTVLTSSTVPATTVNGVATVGAATVSLGVTITLTTVNGVAAVATPTILTQVGATVTPATVAATVSVPAATVAAVGAAGIPPHGIISTPTGRHTSTAGTRRHIHSHG